MNPEGYQHTNSKGVTYYLNTKNVTLRGGRQIDIFYFSKTYRGDTATGLPEDRQVVENPINGFLMVKKVEAK